ncbi:LysR family transcriptional regulator [Paenibacillus sp. BSR1-1]|uniref:LysR family transcriptional regulator n=1 Tax=Paenibacillus sp. BSR1-1 TaxID=3020845 RepID=UPI0025B02019|nr:LysR family transcriptional regulator [Paenibacillus sp. BSR1-1]MDN3015859.1 LysR family transcriptional regulator [Paenibacillus sp. BSR1-1]
MNLIQLEYLLEVAKTKSLIKAAENLHISPSGISKAITNLEMELQLKLFNRSRLGAELTEDGEIIVSKAQEIMLKVEDISIFAHQKIYPEKINISLSVSPNAMLVIPSALVTYKKKYTYSQVEVFEKNPNAILSDVKTEKTDFGITIFTDEMAASNPDLEFETILEGGTVICASKNSPLAYLEKVQIEDLANQSLILTEDPILAGYANELINYVPNINILFTTNNVNVITEAVSEGLGFIITMNLFLNKLTSIQNGSIITIPFVFPHPLRFSVGIVRSRRKKLSEHSKQFIKAFKQNLP